MSVDLLGAARIDPVRLSPRASFGMRPESVRNVSNTVSSIRVEDVRIGAPQDRDKRFGGARCSVGGGASGLGRGLPFGGKRRERPGAGWVSNIDQATRSLHHRKLRHDLH
jgi:hypothetical protein